jgi:hypothetical protein
MVTGIALNAIQHRVFLVLKGHDSDLTLPELQDFLILRDHVGSEGDRGNQKQ